MNKEILLLVDALAREKNVPKEIVFVALESALASATKKRFPTQGPSPEWGSPFAVLKKLDLPATSAVEAKAGRNEGVSPATTKNRGRVDILRQTAHRGGKTVTVVTNFTGSRPAELKQLAKELQKASGAGGTMKDGRIEIQGDHRETVARILTGIGFRPVFAGG